MTVLSLCCVFYLADGLHFLAIVPAIDLWSRVECV